MHQVKLTAACLIFAGSMSLALAPVHAEVARLESVKKLIEQSTAARHVQSSENQEAKQLYEQARQLYEQAVVASKAGKDTDADALLKQASQKMFAAVRLLGPDAATLEKQRMDYNNRLESVNALVTAYDRISKEKDVKKSSRDELHQLVQAKLAEAEKLRDGGDLKAGRKALDEAYVAAKVSVEQLRGGDTLVRSLDFKNKREEYEYEVDRNDTHKMLVDVLLREKMSGNESVRSQVMKFVDKAATIREKAEKHAIQGDYEAAIEALEQSTKEIVRAIRSAGVFIPG